MIAPPSNLVINEVASSLAENFQFEVTNRGSESIDLASYQVILANNAGETTQALSGVLQAGEFLTFDEATLGFKPAAEDRMFLQEAGGDRTVDARVVTNRLRGRLQPQAMNGSSPPQHRLERRISLLSAMRS